MVNSHPQLPDTRIALVREQAALELAELRGMDARTLTAQMLVRKAMLLQFEVTLEGTPEEIEEALQAALELDSNCIEAYIELGRYYYAIQDDVLKAKESFLKGLELLRRYNKEMVLGLVHCDEELQPDRDSCDIQAEYEAMLVTPCDSAAASRES